MTAVITGGSLLVGAVARTDLISAAATEDLTRALWRSLQEELLSLPDGTPVYPTHGAGSFRSAPARILERAGNTSVAVVVGGPTEWAAATGRPLGTR